jgi:hypothetical protein
MNPVYWTEQRCAALRATDPDVYLTDVEAEFADRASAYVPREAIDSCVQRGQATSARRTGLHYVAAIDPATRGNAWTLGIGTRYPSGRFGLVRARQWQGTTREPLRPAAVIEEVRQELQAYGLAMAWTDQWSYDALATIASERGLRLQDAPVTQAGKASWFASLRAMLLEQTIELCDEPAVVEDLARVQRRVTQTGVSYELPVTQDGRHCDFAAMLAMLASRPVGAPATVHESRWEDEARAMRENAMRLARERQVGGEDDL